MTDLLIVKNISREGPGLLYDILDKHSISYDLIEEGENIPSPVGYKAMLAYGGPDSANDQTEKMTQELVRVKESLSSNIPYLGICLGMQVLVKAANGKVVKNKVKEVGFIDHENNPYFVELTEEGKKNPLLNGVSNTPRVFQLHGETVELKSDMTLLATGKHCQNQIVLVGKNAYGIQSHFELTPEMLEIWAAEDPDLVPLGNELLSKQFQQVIEEYTQTGHQLFTNFLSIAHIL